MRKNMLIAMLYLLLPAMLWGQMETDTSFVIEGLTTDGRIIRQVEKIRIE